MRYIRYLFLCVITIFNSVFAEIVVQDGTLEGWEACCEIATTMHTPLIQELSTTNPWLSYILGVSNPEKFMNKNLAKTKELIFDKKSCELFVLHKTNPNNNSSKIVGFFSFIINPEDNTLAHLARHGYLKEEISPDEFKNACANYFVTQEKYMKLERLFAIDLMPNANGPIMTEHRKQSFDFGFVISDKLSEKAQAFDYLPWYKKIPIQCLFTTQVHTLDLKQLRQQIQ